MSDDNLMRLVKEFRELDLEKRLTHTEAIFDIIDRDVQVFIFGLVNPSSAHDILQETLIAIFIYLSTFKGETRSQFYSWWRQIARHKISDEFKKGGRIQKESFPFDETLELIEDERCFPLDAERKHDLELALRLLDKSKPDCRKLLWNHYIIGMDYAEIAEEIGLKYDAVRMKITRCLDSARGLI
jgi:RNA polymerase sigma factor (sigma-70 family)